MSDEINVIVVNRGRKYLYLRYTCPITGERVEKSSGETSERVPNLGSMGGWHPS